MSNDSINSAAAADPVELERQKWDQHYDVCMESWLYQKVKAHPIGFLKCYVGEERLAARKQSLLEQGFRVELNETHLFVWEKEVKEPAAEDSSYKNRDVHAYKQFPQVALTTEKMV